MHDVHKNMLDFLSAQTYGEVPGVFCVEGKEPGPVVGITVCTHGNEPAGLAAADRVKELAEQGKINKGTVFLVVNNLKAAHQHINHIPGVDGHRLVDMDMNRMPKDVLGNEYMGYEASRAKELAPLWKQFEYAMDIHSTGLKADPFLVIPKEGINEDVLKGMPVRMCISNIMTVQNGEPALHFYGNGDESCYAFGIECGQHEDERSFELAKESVEIFLSNLGVISPQDVSREVTPHDEYWVFDSVVFPDNSYEMVRNLAAFEFIPKGSILAEGNGQPIVANADAHALIVRKKKPVDLKNEMLFLAHPPKTVYF